LNAVECGITGLVREFAKYKRMSRI